MSRFVRTTSILCVAVPWIIAAGATILRSATGAEQGSAGELAQHILKATGVQGGLIVQLGCGDGRLTAAFRADDRFLVQGLEADAKNVEAARKYIQSRGVYGKVSIEPWTGKRLPYIDNLVNLLVSENLGGIPMDEVMRVLAPGGMAYVKQGGEWTKTIKPRPADIDEWTHYRHDASGNAVAHDQVVGPPRRLQWTAGPPHTRSHEHIPSLYALVSTGGRIFYIVDEAPIASLRETPRWQLVARDAFNGLELWTKPVGEWFPHMVNWGQTPPQLQRKLVAVGGRVYVTLGLHAPLSVLDAATGQTVAVFKDTLGTEEIVWHKGILLLVVRSITEERVAELRRWEQLAAMEKSPLHARESAEPLVKRLRKVEAGGAKTVLALDAESGRRLWKKEGPEVSLLKTESLSAGGDRVFYQNGRDVVCLDLASGKKLWSTPASPLRVVQGELVFCAGPETVTALSAATGEVQWTAPTSLVGVRDVFVAGGSLWVGGFIPFEVKMKKQWGPAWGPYCLTQFVPTTGQRHRHIEPDNPGHHHRCYDNKATDRYILGGRRGTEFIDLESGEVLWNSWARGVCRYGVMPANGLLYVPPHACACYIAAKLTGFNALAPARNGESGEPKEEESPRLEKGPAFSSNSNPQSPIPSPSSSDWPTYRADAQRSGSTRSPVPLPLHCRWQVDVGRRLTAPTVAGGKVFVASVDEHRLCALDAETGRRAWSFTAGARVDSPPTLDRAQAIFGCRDGHVYCVRATDGALVWRVRAATRPRLLVADAQLESAWPVHGSVLVQGGVVYLTAGRSSYLDGGIDLCRVDPNTGKLMSRTPIYSPDPRTGRQPPHSAPAVMPGARSDILSGDGGHVYLRDMVFDPQGGPLSQGDPHLLTLTDFLDHSWPHRSYWIFGTRCSVAGGCSAREKNLLYGRLLVFNDATVYGYGRASVHWSDQFQDGPYRLFARSRGQTTNEWTTTLPIQARAMVLADKTLFIAGPSSERATEREKRPSAVLLAVSAADGRLLGEFGLDGPPLMDGLAAAGGRLYVALEDGQVVCMAKNH